MRFLTLVAALWSLVPLSPEEVGRGSVTCPMNVTYRSYAVTGLSPEQVRTSLLAHGPKDSRGKQRFASAEWKIEWRWKTTEGGFVEPGTISLSCSAEITMPRLVPTRGTPASLISQWYDFASRVRAHELNHTRHAQERAWLVKARIEQAHRTTGPLTPTEANKIAHAVLREIQALDDAYDAVTEHGRAEGAWAL